MGVFKINETNCVIPMKYVSSQKGRGSASTEGEIYNQSAVLGCESHISASPGLVGLCSGAGGHAPCIISRTRMK